MNFTMIESLSSLLFFLFFCDEYNYIRYKFLLKDPKVSRALLHSVNINRFSINFRYVIKLSNLQLLFYIYFDTCEKMTKMTRQRYILLQDLNTDTICLLIIFSLFIHTRYLSNCSSIFFPLSFVSILRLMITRVQIQILRSRVGDSYATSRNFLTRFISLLCCVYYVFNIVSNREQ